MRVLIAAILSLFLFLLCNNPQKGEMDRQNNMKMEKKNIPSMCAKQPMTADGIVRLSKIEVYPQYLNEYMQYAVEVGEISLRTEPGVLTMYAVSDKENPSVKPLTDRMSLRRIFRNISKGRCTWSSRSSSATRLH